MTSGPSGAYSGSKGKGKKGGGKGGKREFNISKALARILRHTASSLGLNMRSDGFCYVQDVLDIKEIRDYHCDLETLQAIVASNEKARFEIREVTGEWMIRAVQGHSIKSVLDDDAMQKLSANDPNLPQLCVHGTYRRFVDSIKAQGLLPGGGASNRNHVHFAPYEPGDGRVISGMRSSCEVAIYIDLRRALLDGVPFFQSANGVILSPGVNGAIHPKYISNTRYL